jgi:hypothetical protein
MDDKIIFYIIIGIVYFLFNFLKKKRPEQPPETEFPESRQSGRPSAPKPMSFEELLKEITETKHPKTETYTPEPVVPEYEYTTSKREVDYDDDLPEEMSQESESYDTHQNDPIYRQYDEAKQLAFQRASLEETQKLEDVEVKYARFKVFDAVQERNLVQEYAGDLHDPEAIKKAVILSEIINRKHF